MLVLIKSSGNSWQSLRYGLCDLWREIIKIHSFPRDFWGNQDCHSRGCCLLPSPRPAAQLWAWMFFTGIICILWQLTGILVPAGKHVLRLMQGCSKSSKKWWSRCSLKGSGDPLAMGRCRPSRSPQGGCVSCQLGVCTFKETDSTSSGVPHHLALGEVFSKGAGTYWSNEMKTLCSSHKTSGKIVFLPHEMVAVTVSRSSV